MRALARFAVHCFGLAVLALPAAYGQVPPGMGSTGTPYYDWGKNLTADEVSRFVRFWDKVNAITPAQVAAMRSNDWAAAMAGTAWATELNALGYDHQRFWQVFYRCGMVMGWLEQEKTGEDPYAQWAEAQKAYKEAMANPQIPAEYRQMMQAQGAMIEKMKPEKADMDLMRPHYDRLKRVFDQINAKFND